MNFTPLHWAARLTIAATMIFGGVQAQAGLIVEEGLANTSVPVRVLQPEPARRAITLLQRGEVPEDINVIKMSIKDEPLVGALRKIVPTDWKAFARDPRIKSVGRISIQGGGRAWHEVLDEVMERNAMMAIVDWGKKEVTFSMQGDR